jgi:hypothetical protein
MEIPPIPYIFAVLFFNDLVRDGWEIHIEPAYTTVSGAISRIEVTFEKSTTRFSGQGRTLDAAIEDARQQVLAVQTALVRVVEGCK